MARWTLFAMLVVAWWGRGGAPSLSVSQAASQGDAACADCHASIVESYRRSPMARAVRSLDPSELDGLAPVSAPNGSRFRFERRGERASIIEEAIGPDGAPIAGARVEAELLFAIGAGWLDTSYAAKRGDRMSFAPLERLSAHGGHAARAALAPGISIRPEARFDVPINEDCLACHTDAPPPRDYPFDLAPPATWKPSGISCSACHTRAREHAIWRSSDGASGAADPIAASRSKDAIESISTCARCHLQGDARLHLRPGSRGYLAPGGDLLERLAVFVAADEGNDVGFVSHVERMALSRCFTESLAREGRALTCVTCHDPHRSLEEPGERDLVRSACAKCHVGGASSHEPFASACSLEADRRGSQDCASCHMRKTPPFDLEHVEIHDHFIRARPGAPSRFPRIRLKQSNGGELARFAWPGREPPFAGDPGLAMMAYVAAEQRARAGSMVDRAPDPAVARIAQYHHVRGSLLEGLGRDHDAIASYERVLRMQPGDPESTVNLALALHRRQRSREGLEKLDLLLESYPYAEGALRNRALIKLAAGDREGFRADLEAAHAIAPRAANARSLASFWRQVGDATQVERWTLEAKRLDPSSAAPATR